MQLYMYTLAGDFERDLDLDLDIALKWLNKDKNLKSLLTQIKEWFEIYIYIYVDN